MIKFNYLVPPVLLGWLLFTGAGHVQPSSSSTFDGALLFLSGPEDPGSTLPGSDSLVLLATRHATKSPRALLLRSRKNENAGRFWRTSEDRNSFLKEAERNLEKNKGKKKEIQNSTKNK